VQAVAPMARLGRETQDLRITSMTQQFRRDGRVRLSAANVNPSAEQNRRLTRAVAGRNWIVRC
jgi:hypothetical protein